MSSLLNPQRRRHPAEEMSSRRMRMNHPTFTPHITPYPPHQQFHFSQPLRSHRPLTYIQPLPPPVAPVASSSSGLHAPLTCNTCNKAPVKTSPVTASSSPHSMLARCSGCRAVYYCSRVCQRNDWNRHKFLCRHVRLMDVHQLSYLKLSSTIPGNFHRPVLPPEVEAATVAASLGLPYHPPSNPSTSTLNPTSTTSSSATSAEAKTGGSTTSTPQPSSSPLPSTTPIAIELSSITLTTPNDKNSMLSSYPSYGDPALSSNLPSVPEAAASSDPNDSSNISASSVVASSSPVPPSSVGSSTPSSPSVSLARTVRSKRSRAPLTVNTPIGQIAPTDTNNQSGPTATSNSTAAAGPSPAVSRNEMLASTNECQPTSFDLNQRLSKRQKTETPTHPLKPATVNESHDKPFQAMNNSDAGDVSSSTVSSSSPPTVPLALQPVVLQPNGMIGSYAPAAIETAYGLRPARGQTCLLFFQGRHSNGTIFTKNREIFFNSSSNQVPSASSLTPAALEWIHELDGATPLSFTVGIGEVIESWDHCVATMFRGESTTIITRDENRHVFVYELQLVDFW